MRTPGATAGGPVQRPPAHADAGPEPALFASRFQIVRPIGRGATSRVDAAWDQATRCLVALKRLDAAVEGGAAAVANEARTLQRLDHPDIVTVTAVGHADAQAWIAMALAPGAELSRYTVAARALPLPVVLQLGARMARALAHAHRRGVVHRDLKPANVRIDWPTSKLTVLDFGLARSADSLATRTGMVPGSPAYMAPELLAGAVPSAASDLYALGATLFHLLAARPPHDAATLGGLLQSVAANTAPPLQALRPDASPALDRLLAALLERRPEDRPATAATVADALIVEAGGSRTAPRATPGG